MLGFINRMQVVIFALVSQHIVDQAKIEEAERLVEHYRGLLAVLTKGVEVGGEECRV